MRNTIYKLTEYDQATPGVQNIYDESKRMLGLPFVLNWIKCQGSNEDLLTGNWTKLKNTLIVGKVPNILKQLIIYNVSAKKGCDYCSQAHGIFANMMGKSMHSDTDFKITENLETELVPKSYRTAIRVVTNAALAPASITDKDVEDLQDAGFSEGEITELLAQADLVNMLNTIADISGIKIDSELLEMAN
ncbi:MAG: carboxymuconolactone decarboxylase family protein [Sphingobacteriales bacterium]|nr:MAG: carboxymuconolactone decarboxylase family protein [Sphingobacteriales bacterium]